MRYIPHDGLNFNNSDTGSGTPFLFQHGLGADLTQPVALVNVGTARCDIRPRRGIGQIRSFYLPKSV